MTTSQVFAHLPLPSPLGLRRSDTSLLVLAALSLLLLALPAQAQSSAQALQITFGTKALQTLTFASTPLEDVGANSGDAFHIWHMKATDLQGNTLTSAQFDWGENNNGTSWNPSTHTETYTFTWGSIATQFVQTGNTLDLIVTESNNPNSGILFDGAEIYPFALHFPQDPVGFSGYTQFAITTTGPGVLPADFGTGIVTAVIPNEAPPLYTGWRSAGNNTYTPILTSTAPDGLATFLPHNDRPVPPGTSFTYTVSLRFTPPGTPANASDAYTSFAATYPSQMTWTDKRIIGTAYLASSPPGGGDNTQPGGFPTNPRRYFNDPAVDVTTPAGLQAFQTRILAQATAQVTNAQALSAQGVITWDLEGEQYPQDTSYVCSPDQIAAVAPEMESLITSTASPYFGQKLDDAYFRTMTSAGLKVGVCLRPQVFTLGPNNTARQLFLTNNAALIANLEKKASIANARWGATLFYVDSTVDPNGGVLDPAIFQQLITDLPSFLFIPEESTPRYYAYSAPFYTFLFHTDLGTPKSTYNFYPKAFGANLINDVSAQTLATYQSQLTASVTAGDILMGLASYWQANDPTLVSIYHAAGSTPTPTPSPIQTTPSLNWNNPAPIIYGTPLSAAQLNASANTAGSFVYTPPAGTLPNAGSTTLLATFTPTDTRDYTAATTSVPLTVTPATPTLTWPTPTPIPFGTPLGPGQLNASASVPGAFTYTPAAGATPAPGTIPLNLSFTPSDAANYTSATASVSLTVTPAALANPTLSWPNPAPISFGTALSPTQLNASANVPGTFIYTPAAGSRLNAGISFLTAVFTPADPAAYSPASASVPLNITRATPTLTWPAPAPILSGTALSSTQLNASANIPGTFTYTPSAGIIPAPGTQILTASFIPADTMDYTAQTASASLTINSPAPSSSNLAILSPAPGDQVSGTVIVVAQCLLPLDPAGSYLLVDGLEVGSHRVSNGPYLYPLDTSTLTNGPHLLQLWAHDIGNNTTLSAIIPFTVSN